MKTAMQLMIWYLENEGLEESGAYYKAKMLLEKEKESIIDAFVQGGEQWNSEDASVEYYNKTYNQNK
jgi:hypothetical protein